MARTVLQALDGQRHRRHRFGTMETIGGLLAGVVGTSSSRAGVSDHRFAGTLAYALIALLEVQLSAALMQAVLKGMACFVA